LLAVLPALYSLHAIDEGSVGGEALLRMLRMTALVWCSWLVRGDAAGGGEWSWHGSGVRVGAAACVYM